MEEEGGEKENDVSPEGTAGEGTTGTGENAKTAESAEAAETAATTEAAKAEIDAFLGEAPPLSGDEVRAIVEALIFASPEPLTPREIGKVLPGVAKEAWEAAVEELSADYARAGRGLQLVEVAAGYQITTRPELNDHVRELLDPRSPTRLSIQALETLAVIAYKQPVTLPEVIELRGVKSGGVLKTLLEKRLIKIVGRKEVVGRPMLYGTTKEFLLHFGLRDLAELPKIEEFAEVLGEEVDVVGLKRAIDAPRPVEVPLAEGEAAQGQITFEVPVPDEDAGEEKSPEEV